MTWRCSVPPAPLPPPPPWCLRHPLPPPRGRASSAGACPADGHAERASAFRSHLTGWTSAAHAARDDVGRAPQRTDCCSGGATVTMRPNDRVRWMRRRWPGYAPWRVRAVKVGFSLSLSQTRPPGGLVSSTNVFSRALQHYCTYAGGGKSSARAPSCNVRRRRRASHAHHRTPGAAAAR